MFGGLLANFDTAGEFGAVRWRQEPVRIARASFPKGSRYMRLRDELGAVFDDSRFAGLFPTRGRPAEAPWRLALVTLFQFAEGLPDRQAAEAVRGRIDWKYALALPLSSQPAPAAHQGS